MPPVFGATPAQSVPVILMVLLPLASNWTMTQTRAMRVLPQDFACTLARYAGLHEAYSHSPHFLAAWTGKMPIYR